MEKFVEKLLGAPKFPANEVERLAALKCTALLDSSPEDRFDLFTRLAARIFNVPICLISLVDSERQWFKSRVGLEACETARDISFCGHAILQPDIFIISDASKDKRFFANPLVTNEPHIRFYAGAPVLDPTGYAIGTLCLIDTLPRAFSTNEAQMLRELADIVEHEIARLDEQKVRQQLSSGSARVTSIITTLPDMVFVIDRNFKFLLCNDHPDLLKPKHDILGHKIIDVLPHDLATQLMNFVKQAFDSDKLIYHNYTIAEANKSFEARYRKIDEDEVLIVIRNVTEQSAAYSSLRRLSEVARQTTNAVVITDIKGLVLWVNEAFTAITGYCIEEIVGKKPGDVLQGENTDPASIDKMSVALASQHRFDIDVLNYTKERKPYWIRIACNPLLNEKGDVAGFIAIQTDITKEKRDEELIRNNEKLLKAVIDANTIGTWRLNLQNDELVINDKWAALLGYEVSELFPVNKNTWERLTHPEDLIYCTKQIKKHVSGLAPMYEADIRMKHKNGEWIWINTRGKVSSRTSDDKAEWLLGTHFDISERVKAESLLNEKSKQMHAVVESMLDGVITTDNRGKILTFNQAAKEIFGYCSDEIVGKGISVLFDSPYSFSYSLNSINRAYTGKASHTQELDAIHKNNTTFPIELGLVEVKMAGEYSTIVIVRDITQRKNREQEIHKLAFYDPLTLLPNRRLLMDRLQSAVIHCSRDNNFAGLMFLDLDNFKNLNDSAGHSKGDLLLCQVAERLVQSVRQGDTVSRLGGDEFVVVLLDLGYDEQTAANQAETVARKMITHLTGEYNLEGLVYNSSASIGVTIFNNANVSEDDLLRQADMAMYKAKDMGRNTVQFFDPQMQDAVSSRATLVNDLYKAIEQQQFVLYYQKQVNQNASVVGVEVLLRWCHPEKGMISPAQFIPLTEETGLIVPIGEWILREACKTLVQWARKPNMKTLSVAVNISVVQFSKNNFVQVVLDTLNDSGANPKLLKLEITESLLAKNIADVKSKMQELQKYGIKFSIDDFGTGYSSLSYLKQLPINQLKIDQGFVRDIINNSNDRAIARAVIMLAKSMELQVIAEGVETTQQQVMLQTMGCNFYQGYLFGKPCPLEAL